MRWVELSWVELSWVELSWAELSWAELSWAELSWAELSWVELSWVEVELLRFLAVHRQLNRWPCHSLTHWVSHFWFLTLKSNPEDIWQYNLPNWPTYLTYLSDIPNWPTYLTYLPYLTPAYLIYLSYRAIYLFTFLEEHTWGAIKWICDIWDTDYNSDNWELEFMTIFVTWQLRVTVDSIRNSFNVSA